MCREVVVGARRGLRLAPPARGREGAATSWKPLYQQPPPCRGPASSGPPSATPQLQVGRRAPAVGLKVLPTPAWTPAWSTATGSPLPGPPPRGAQGWAPTACGPLQVQPHPPQGPPLWGQLLGWSLFRTCCPPISSCPGRARPCSLRGSRSSLPTWGGLSGAWGGLPHSRCWEPPQPSLLAATGSAPPAHTCLTLVGVCQLWLPATAPRLDKEPGPVAPSPPSGGAD